MHKIRHSEQRGSVLLESLIGMCFLLFMCFALVELFMMIGRQMALDYASFYGAKALVRGFNGENCRKAVHVAGIPASGKDESTWLRIPLSASSAGVRSGLRDQARRYMSLGRTSGVEYAHWYNKRGNLPYFSVSLNASNDFVLCQTRLMNPPFLIPAMAHFMEMTASGQGKNVEPSGETRMYNHAKQWMDE